MEQHNENANEITTATETANALLVAVDHASTILHEYLENGGVTTNYFKATELLLRNYKELALLVVDAETYMADARKERSKSLVTYRSNAGGMPQGEAEDEAERIRISNYAYTKDRFDEIARVVRVYAGRKEMRVVRMYYFREDADGNERGGEEQDITFEDIAVALGKDVKTVRRWRSRLVNDMAIALFGKGAAIEAGAYRGKKQQSLTSA